MKDTDNQCALYLKKKWGMFGIDFEIAKITFQNMF